MRWTTNRIAAMVLVGCVAGTGCDESSMDGDSSEDSSDQDTESRKGVHNAPVLNSSNLNGWSLNGWSLNGESFNGWSLNGWSLNGWSLNGLSLNGSAFHATYEVPGQPQVVSGTDMRGAQMTLSYGDSIYILTLDDIRLDENNPAGEVYVYDISVLDLFQGVTKPLCTINGAAVPAIPLINYWNPTTGDRIDDSNIVTFACRGGALAKCVDWGYLPWSTATRCEGQSCEEISMAEHHQACTRMVRADYCGDGTPHTQNGTPIDIYDALSPQIQAPSTGNQPAWGIEAEWGPDGARCVGSMRRLKIFEDLGIPIETPACLEDLEGIAGCGDLDPARGASVADRYCDAWTSNPGACSDPP